MPTLRDALPNRLHTLLARGRDAVAVRARQLPRPVASRLGSLRRRVTNSRSDSTRTNFTDDGAYFDHLIESAIADAQDSHS